MAVGHAFVPVHAMSQLVARVQSIDALHAVDPHSTRQGTPTGQVTLPVQLLVAVQSTTQVAPEHVPIVQAARQAATAAGSAASAIAESRKGAPPELLVGPSASEEPPEPAADPSNDDAIPASAPPAPPAVDEAPAPGFAPVPASPLDPAGRRS
jgi:hypothetical protein